MPGAVPEVPEAHGVVDMRHQILACTSPQYLLKNIINLRHFVHTPSYLLENTDALIIYLFILCSGPDKVVNI